MKTVYVVMCAEFFHHGHLNIIKVARELGEVTVGLATDEFNARYKRLSVMNYEQRRAVVENIKGVKRVIPQETLDLAPVLRELKPDYFVHGDDWQTGPLVTVRQQLIEVMQEWGGILVEPPYTKGISSTELNASWHSIGITPEGRIQRFRRLLAYQPFGRVLEVHSGLTGVISEHTQVKIDGKIREFDAMWLSSLTDSLAKGKPNIGYVDLTSQLNTIHDILEGTTKPLLVDGRNGGIKEHFPYTVKTLERLGVSAVVLNNENGAETQYFADKISAGKKAQVNADFAIIVRITPHPALTDSLQQAQAYLAAGADAIMVQGSAEQSDELLEFCRLFTKQTFTSPLLAILPGNSSVTEGKLANAGVRLAIYPDQLFRAAYTSMVKTAETLLSYSNAHDVDKASLSIDEICAKLYPLHG